MEKEGIELHMDINAMLVIPEWLRAKMGLTQEVEDDADEKPCDCDDESCEDCEDAEERAHRKALDELLKVLADSGSSGVSYTVHHHVHRRKPRL